MNRRDLLGLGLAAAGGIFAPRFGRWYRQSSGLLLYADGVHDDSVALQAYLDGRPVSIRELDGRIVPATYATASGRHYLLSRTLEIGGERRPVANGIGMMHSVLRWTSPVAGMVVV